MAERGGQEEQYGTSGDPVAAPHETFSSEPVATEPLETVVTESDSSISDTEKKQYAEKE